MPPSPRAQDRETCAPGTGPQAAASNYLLALQSMVQMAAALGEAADAAHLAAQLDVMQRAYDARFWNETVGGYVGARPPLEHQTLCGLAINAMAGASLPHAAARVEATATLLREDVAARDFHLTVGSVGQQWLLRTLSEVGGHDDALRVATQTTQPSWGFWDANGATTCWENWSGVADLSHPPPPTHNHIFLCGGLSAWMHQYLGGISPAEDGYARVRIAPYVSATLGPSAVNASVSTIRGRVESAWSRSAAAAEANNDAAAGVELLRLHVRVPTGTQAEVQLPLLGRAAGAVLVHESQAGMLWPRSAEPVGAGVGTVDASAGKVHIAIAAGAYTFILRTRGVSGHGDPNGLLPPSSESM